MNYRLIDSINISNGFKYLTYEPNEAISTPSPGQFVMVRVEDCNAPYLRRPMSLADWGDDGSFITLLVQQIGSGTRIMNESPIETCVDIIGPFGQGFRVGEKIKNIWIVAGGTGVAPFIGLTRTKKADYRLFLGAKSSKSLIFRNKLEYNGVDVVAVTEDGSAGEKGIVTDPLEAALRIGETPDAILTCGPTPMMRAVVEIAKKQGIPCQVSLENRMACGFGACLGCVVKKQKEEGYRTVCKGGPVFDSREVIF